MLFPPGADSTSGDYDLIVIGSGFGGAMAAAPAVFAGRRVLMLEAGDWVERGPQNWEPAGASEKTPYYSKAAAFDVITGGYGRSVGTYLCVGGASVFYGGVALRMREADFEPDPAIDRDSGAAWPYRYSDIEPFYSEAEQLLQVAGVTGEDPTEPRRSKPYPYPPAPLAPISDRISTAARSLGLHPFRLPLAINHTVSDGRTICPRCGTCDGFACAVQAKNDISTILIPRLQAAGLVLETNSLVVRLEHERGRITAVQAVRVDDSARPIRFRGSTVVVAAGALSTPRLLLASDLARVSPAGPTIGRYLMRHCNAVVMGWFRERPAPNAEFHKQVGIHDFYFGHPSVSSPQGRLGCLQQFATPLPSLVRDFLPLGLGRVVAPIASHTTGFIVMAEDRPQAGNGVTITGPIADNTLPRASVTHRYDLRDLAARRALVHAARRILRRAGALATYVHPIKTFSHALGTVRLGVDPARSPLDRWGAFRGMDNLYVTDASALPRSAGVNPSLTIAANALRTGHHIRERLGKGTP